MDERDKKFELAKALMQDYLSARQEIMLHIGSYDNQTKHTRLAYTVLIIFVPLVPYAFGWGGLPQLRISEPAVAFILVNALLLLSAMVHYLFLQVVENQVALVGHAVRVEFIEEKLNKIFEDPTAFLWESRLSKLVWTKLPPRHPTFWNSKIALLFVLAMGSIVPLAVSWGAVWPLHKDDCLLTLNIAVVSLLIVLFATAALASGHYIYGKFRPETALKFKDAYEAAASQNQSS